MESRHIALALALEAADLDFSIASRNDRMRVQKAVYLIQAAGVRLGYRHGWYVYGPYSPAMTQDYYAVDEMIQNGTFSTSGWHLTRAALDSIERVRDAFAPPAESGLEQPQWLELLASILFLVRESSYELDQAVSTVERRKPHLQGEGKHAIKVLKACGLL